MTRRIDESIVKQCNQCGAVNQTADERCRWCGGAQFTRGRVLTLEEQRRDHMRIEYQSERPSAIAWCVATFAGSMVGSLLGWMAQLVMARKGWLP